MRSVQVGMSYDDVRAGLREAFRQQVICIGLKCLATTKRWGYVIMVDVEEKKLWRFYKSFADEQDQSDPLRSVDLRFKSPVVEWPSITIKDVDFFADIWRGYWLLNTGE